MILRLENVFKTYGNGVKALDDVTIDINAGMFGLLGPNGAGNLYLFSYVDWYNRSHGNGMCATIASP